MLSCIFRYLYIYFLNKLSSSCLSEDIRKGLLLDYQESLDICWLHCFVFFGFFNESFMYPSNWDSNFIFNRDLSYYGFQFMLKVHLSKQKLLKKKDNRSNLHIIYTPKGSWNTSLYFTTKSSVSGCWPKHWQTFAHKCVTPISLLSAFQI